jgi:Mg-chelatase subunit ChlD
MPPYSARARLIGNLAGVALFVAAAAWWSPPQAPDAEGGRRESAIDRAIASPAGDTARDGIAALVLMDVSGSMAEGVRTADGKEPKIDVARRAALVLIRQFDAYAAAHPDEPVLVGLYEFSERDDQPHGREIIPLSRADPARAEGALAAMRPGGGTPIGDAMIAGKRALDRAGLSRRHLLVVTDGENTDGPAPSAVMRAIGRRPESERPSVYFVAFDIDRSRFDRVREAGALVLAASNAEELNATLSSLLTGKILVEGP